MGTTNLIKTVLGLSDLINAETEQQRRQALRQMDGVLFERFRKWRQNLIKVVADVEGFIFLLLTRTRSYKECCHRKLCYARII